MSEETIHGVPRRMIPWYPTINYEKCVAYLRVLLVFEWQFVFPSCFAEFKRKTITIFKYCYIYSGANNR